MLFPSGIVHELVRKAEASRAAGFQGSLEMHLVPPYIDP